VGVNLKGQIKKLYERKPAVNGEKPGKERQSEKWRKARQRASDRKMEKSQAKSFRPKNKMVSNKKWRKVARGVK
jgi:hypothetical protein